jgi:hypothetical protein
MNPALAIELIEKTRDYNEDLEDTLEDIQVVAKVCLLSTRKTIRPRHLHSLADGYTEQLHEAFVYHYDNRNTDCQLVTVATGIIAHHRPVGNRQYHRKFSTYSCT